jgi:preprotein translocase subunit SecG
MFKQSGGERIMKKILAAAMVLFFVGSAGLALAQDKNGKNPSMSPKHRLRRQHKRIMQGVKSGKISKSEHKQLAQEGKDINQERKADLAKDGGKLDQSDRQNLESQENLRSEQIKQDKQDGSN